MDAATRAAVEAFGTTFESLGASRNFGRVWALLHVREEPLTQQEIAATLHLSQSVVSTTLRQLAAAQMVEKARGGGHRAARYGLSPVPAGLAAKVSQARMEIMVGLFDRLAALPLSEARSHHIERQIAFYRYMAQGMQRLIAAWEAEEEGR